MQMVRTQRIQKSTFMCIFIVKLITNNHMKVRLIFILFFVFLANRSCKWPYTGCEKIRRQITKHRIIYKNEKLKLLQINGADLTGSFEQLSKVLTWICWLECPLGFLPSDFVGVVCK